MIKKKKVRTLSKGRRPERHRRLWAPPLLCLVIWGHDAGMTWSPGSSSSFSPFLNMKSRKAQAKAMTRVCC